MSRHFFDCEMRCKVRVQLGYRSVSKEYFLEVERIGPDAGQGFLYDSGDNSSSIPRSNLNSFRKELKRLGLVVPESMFRAVEKDAARLSTRHVQHFADGRTLEFKCD